MRRTAYLGARKRVGPLVSVITGVLMLLMAFSPGGSAFAQGMQPGVTGVAGGLTNPGPVALGDDGSVYVAEAGMGGAEKFSDPEAGSGTRGTTGQITRIGADGSRTVIARNLPSTMSEEGASGASDMIYGNGALWAVWAGAPPGLQRLPLEGSLVRIDLNTGEARAVADLVGFEAKNNPDPNQVDSNPYGLTLGPDGMVYVADAGGNDVLKVDPNTGQVSLVAVIPGLPVPAEQEQPGGNPERGGKQELDPVPTAVQFGPDGALYVSLLSGAPFPTGASRVVRVTMDGKVSDAVPGLTMTTDLDKGPGGSWYALQVAQFSFTSTPPGPLPASGAIIQIGANGQRQTLVSGLTFVQKIAVDNSGDIYASMVTGDLLRLSPSAAGGEIKLATPGMPSTGSPAQRVDPLFGLAGVLLLALGVSLRLYAVRRAPAER